MLLIGSDMFKALWYWIPAITILARREPISHGFCHGAGFLLAVGVEASGPWRSIDAQYHLLICRIRFRYPPHRNPYGPYDLYIAPGKHSNWPISLSMGSLPLLGVVLNTHGCIGVRESEQSLCVSGNILLYVFSELTLLLLDQIMSLETFLGSSCSVDMFQGSTIILGQAILTPKW